MRVTNAMMLNQALQDLGGLREKYAKAQAAVNGRALERPSEDPQRVVEAMDLSGSKLRLERAKRSGEDATEWLSVADLGLTAMIEQLQSARETVIQAGGPANLNVDSREALARSVLAIRDSVFRELNTKHRDQYLYAGWNMGVTPFTLDGDGGVTYAADSTGQMTRDVAPGLAVTVNVTGSEIMANGDWVNTLSQIGEGLRSGNVDSMILARLPDLDQAITTLSTLRSDVGTRQQQVEQYMSFAQEGLFQIEDRLQKITGVDLEAAVLQMTEAQNAYQAALASFAKALPTSLLDYMLR